MNDRMCSLGSGSFVDALSNLAYLDCIDTWTAIRGIGEGLMPDEALPVVHHELLHHWAQNSPTGQALSIAKISAMWAIFGGGRTAPEGVSPGDYAKFLTAGTLLRAFSEGLAQYAEFDVLSGGARSESFVMAAAAWLWGSAGAAADPFGKFNEKLRAVRLTRPVVERKANALRQPFSVRNGGYLPGYLAVKRLAARLQAAGGPFEDHDFVLSYLKAFVFHDPAAVMASLQLDGMEFLGWYFQHMANRFAQLAAVSDEKLRQAGEDLDEFFAGCRPTTDEEQTLLQQMLPGLFTDPMDHARAFSMLATRFDQLGVFRGYRHSSADGPENVIERLYRALTQQRHLFCVAASDVPAGDVLSGRTTKNEPLILVRGPGGQRLMLSHWHPERYADLGGRGPDDIDEASLQRVDLPGLRFELWVDPVRLQWFLCLHSGEAKKVGILCANAACGKDELPDVEPRNDTVRLLDQIDEALSQAPLATRPGASPSTLAEATTGLKVSVQQQTEDLLMHVAFPGDGSAEMAQRFRAKGMGGLSSYSPDALRGLALLGLAAGAGTDAETARAQAALPPECIEAGRRMIDEMERLRWPVEACGVWVV